MGSYVLYLMMQAFVALIFAYLSGTLVLQGRRLHMLLASLGLYLLMGSALLEVWGDRAGWEVWAIGLNAAVVATSVALLGTGLLLREARHMARPRTSELLGQVLLGISVVMGAVLAISGGSSSSVVDPGDVASAEISGAFHHLGPAGWALGAPLFIGAALLIWLGFRTALVKADTRGLWFVGSGVLLLLWPFDLYLSGLPLSPSVMMMAIVMVYFGHQPPKDDGGVEDGGRDGREDDGEAVGGHDQTDGAHDDGISPWVREAIAAQAPEGVDGDRDGE